MEVAHGLAGHHGKCSLAKEEIILTPHHTPSQSFDFIVWEKARLDSISAGTPGSSPGTPNAAGAASLGITQICNDESSPASTCAIRNADRNGSPCACEPPASTCSDSNSALLACRTDADLPSCFLEHKLRLSDGESAEPLYHCSCPRCRWLQSEWLSCLEEAVARSYVEGHLSATTVQENIRLTQDDGSHEFCHAANSDLYSQNFRQMKMQNNPADCKFAQRHAEAGRGSRNMSKIFFLKRSMSQPGNHPQHESLAGAKNHSHQHRHRFHGIHNCMSKPACDKHSGDLSAGDHIHHYNDGMPQPDTVMARSFLSNFSPGRRRQCEMQSPPYDARKFTKQGETAGAVLPWLHADSIPFHYQKSWSATPSMSSSQFEECHFHVQDAMMSKMKWGRLRHKLTSLWRKLCFSCP